MSDEHDEPPVFGLGGTGPFSEPGLDDQQLDGAGLDDGSLHEAGPNDGALGDGAPGLGELEPAGGPFSAPVAGEEPAVEEFSGEEPSVEEFSGEEPSVEEFSGEELSGGEPSGAENDYPAPLAGGGEGLDDDPFRAWPQPASQTMVEDAPAEGVSVEHVSGEIDVPDGYTVLEGTPTGHRRSVALVVSRFNGGLTNRMLACAIEALEEAGVAAAAVTVVPVPGAFELPLTAMALAKTRRYACVVALGVIVRGETPHFDYIAAEAASGLQLAGIETGVPVAFGVLTVETVEQAEARVERAGEAVRTALEMADLFARLRASARAG